MNSYEEASVLAHQLLRPEPEKEKAGRVILMLIDYHQAMRANRDALVIRVEALQEENRRLRAELAKK